jgi:hypothetical protein
MKPTTDSIKLEWCYTHNQWYVDNVGVCPDCYCDNVKEEHRTEILKVTEQRDELQAQLDELGRKE